MDSVFACSDWLLKLGVAPAVYRLGFYFWFRARVFPHFSEEKELFGAGYTLVWYILTRLLTSVLGNYHHFSPPLR